MVSSKPGRKPPAVQASGKARKSDRSRASGPGRTAKNAEQHPEAGAASTAKTTLKRYLVVVEKANGNYGAHAPDLPGCGALGDTVEETLQNMKRAIEMHVRGMQEDGDAIPEPSTIGQYVEVQEPRMVKTA
jgi:predicted RNase H-like HicB family nuclease